MVRGVLVSYPLDSGACRLLMAKLSDLSSFGELEEGAFVEVSHTVLLDNPHNTYYHHSLPLFSIIIHQGHYHHHKDQQNDKISVCNHRLMPGGFY